MSTDPLDLVAYGLRCWMDGLNGAADLFGNSANRDQTFTGAEVAAILRAEAES